MKLISSLLVGVSFPRQRRLLRPVAESLEILPQSVDQGDRMSRRQERLYPVRWRSSDDSAGPLIT